MIQQLFQKANAMKMIIKIDAVETLSALAADTVSRRIYTPIMRCVT